MNNYPIKPLCKGCPHRATIHVTAIVNGKLQEVHLCEQCPLTNIVKGFDVQGVLENLLPKPPKLSEQQINLRCENCGTTYLEFQQKGLLGCSHCYDVFKEQLSGLLKQIHGTDIHVGKAPMGVRPLTSSVECIKEVNRIEKLFNLKEEMSDAVKKENFEYAAQLKNMIEEIEHKDVKDSFHFLAEGI